MGKRGEKSQLKTNLGYGVDLPSGKNFPIPLLNSGTSLSMQMGDSPSLDAFGRQRVSSPKVLFDITTAYDKQDFFWEDVITDVSGNAKTTHLPNESSVEMQVGTSNTDQVIRQTLNHSKYQPGKGQLILFTGILGAAKSNVRSRFGLFQDENGFYYERDENNLKIVHRDSTSGTVVNTAINQADWNADKLDGTGGSGITIDSSLAQLFFIDLAWLGVGRVRLGIINNGIAIIAHQFFFDNTRTTPYMTTATLPVRAEITNTAATASITTMKLICVSVISESGQALTGVDYTANNGSTSVNVGARNPVLSIKPNTVFPSTTISNHIIIELQKFSAISFSSAVFYEIIYNPTLSGASWAVVNSSSGMQFDVAATSITAGVVIDSGYIPGNVRGGGQAASGDAIIGGLTSKLPITLTNNESSSTIVTLALTSINATGASSSSNCLGSFTWREIQ